MKKNDIVSRLAIVKLENDFAKTWDNGDSTRHASLYSEDAVLEMEAAGALPAVTIRGRDTLGKFCSETSQSYPGLHLIDISSIDINTKGDVAKGEIRFEFLYREQNNDEPHRVTGVYQSTYVRKYSRWRIQRRHMVKSEEHPMGFFDIPSVG